MKFEQQEQREIFKTEKRSGDVSMDKPEYKQLGRQGECIFFTNRGPEAKKKNDDGLVIVADNKDCITLFVSDGIGEPGNGDIATNTCCDAVINSATSNNSNLDAISRSMENAINSNSELNELQGCCYALVRIEQNTLNIRYTGDVRTIVIRNNKVVFATKDDGPRLWESRKFIKSYIIKNKNKYKKESFKLEYDDIVIVCTDGVTDNVDEKITETKLLRSIEVKDQKAGNNTLARIASTEASDSKTNEGNLASIAECLQKFIMERMESIREEIVILYKNPTREIIYERDNRLRNATNVPTTPNAKKKFENKILIDVVVEHVMRSTTAKRDNFTFVIYIHTK